MVSWTVSRVGRVDRSIFAYAIDVSNTNRIISCFKFGGVGWM